VFLNSGGHISDPLYTVNSFPLYIYRKRGVFALFIVVFITCLTYVITDNYFFAIISFLVLSMPVVNFLFPTKYLFYEDYLTKRVILHWQKFSYVDFESFDSGTGGILLKRKDGKGEEKIIISDEEERKKIIEFLKVRPPFL